MTHAEDGGSRRERNPRGRTSRAVAERGVAERGVSGRPARTAARPPRTGPVPQVGKEAPRAGKGVPRAHGARVAVGQAGTALVQWLRRPLTSLHLVIGVFGLLTLFGLVMVLSASSVESFTEVGSTYSVFTRQLLFCVPGLVLFWAGLRIPPSALRRLAPAALLVGVLSLVAVLLFGEERNGSKAWFAIGETITLQPSEAVKVALTLWGAHVLVARRAVMHRWKYAISPVVPVTVVLLVLLVLQPDLGMTITVGIVLIALLFFAGAPIRLMLALTGGATAGALVLAVSANYRLSRITSFLSPGDDPLTAGFQANQALYSLANGGLFGVGLGGSRAKWNYLPNAHNDFIFAIIGEELGFVGAFAVLVLFATLAYTGFRIAARNTDPWLKLVVATSTTWLVAQAAINIGYVVGLLPVTGLQLPLISSGGTSLVVTMFVFGILANAARHEPEAVAALRQHGQSRVERLLRLPVPQPYKAPIARPPASRARVR